MIQKFTAVWEVRVKIVYNLGLSFFRLEENAAIAQYLLWLIAIARDSNYEELSQLKKATCSLFLPSLQTCKVSSKSEDDTSRMFLVRSVDNPNHLVHTSRDLEQFYHSMPTHPMPCYAHIPICAPSFQHTYIALNDFVSTLPTCRLAEIYSISVARATICCTTGSVLLPQLQFKSLAVIFSISFYTIFVRIASYFTPRQE